LLVYDPLYAPFSSLMLAVAPSPFSSI